MTSPKFTFACVGFAMAVLLVGCGALMINAIPGGKDLMSGASYIGQLAEAGKLPGVETNDHPKFESVPVPLTNRPQALTIWLTVPEKTNTVFSYQITRSNRQAPWTLIYAVQADTNGQNSVDLLKAPVPDSKEIELETKSKSQ